MAPDRNHLDAMDDSVTLFGERSHCPAKAQTALPLLWRTESRSAGTDNSAEIAAKSKLGSLELAKLLIFSLEELV